MAEKIFTNGQLEHVKDEETVIMFDVDSFKQVNDKFGHAICDKALKYAVITSLEINEKRGKCLVAKTTLASFDF